MPPETYVLSFDTSAAHCAAALLLGNRLLSHRVEAMEKGQAERLMPMLEEMLSEIGIGWRDLGVLGVGTGPGNFTGVRLSVAAARGLALGLGIAAVGVTALEAQAYGTAGQVVSSLDARRGLLYVQTFRPDGAATLCDLNNLPRIEASGEPSCIGHAATEIAAQCAGHVTASRYPLAEAVARIAGLRRAGAPRPAPFYLRGADAAPPSDPPPLILP